jgi:phage baseplate assembly protein gpV
MNFQQVLNIIRREVARVIGQIALNRVGVVTSYDPATYSAKVLLQPENTETGWLPIATAWSGNGWGLFCPPSPGDVVDVHFQEGGKDAGIIGLRHYGNKFTPKPVPSGEFWLAHQSGSYLKFFNDGGVIVNTAHNLIALVGGAVTMNAAAGYFLTGDVNVFGNLTVSGDISDQFGANGTIQNIRDVYDTHTHNTPSGVSDKPNQPL